MQGFYRNLALWFLLILFLVVLYNIFHVPEQTASRWNYSDFVAAVEKGDVQKVTIFDGKVQGETSDSKQFVVFTPEDPQLLSILRQHQVVVEVEPVPEEPLWKPLLISWFPMLLIIGLWVMMIRQMQTGGGKAMAFGKARVKLANENPTPITFADVAGVDEAKEELKEIVDFLKDPGKFTRFGGRIPKGVLLIGSPGAGKTLLAKAVAGEAGVPFYSISGSDFVEMFVGVGASRVRDLFMQARKSAPGIVFIDEIDAVGRHRGAGLGGGHDEREQTLNQLLVEMDGMDSSEGVIIIAATNRPDVLDPALLRPGRFDRRVVVPLPDWKGRREIIGVHIKKKKVPMAVDVDIESLARATPGFSGADLENLVNEAALLAARKHRDPSAAAIVVNSDFEQAKDKVLMGAERRSMVLTEKEKRITAYHEAGHALVAKYLPGSDPVHKVTIIPRGMALGLTQPLPEQEMHTYSRDYLNVNLKVLMGGRAAEEIAFNSITTGAGNDIERATDLARRMVCEWGMSDKIGPLRFGKGNSEVFLGRDFANVKDYSESTAILIDQEVREMVNHSYAEAKRILLEHKNVLDAVSLALLERETIGAVELDLLIAGQPLPPMAEPSKSALVASADPEKSKRHAEANDPVSPPPGAIPAGASVSG